ncbi:hypothetical protein RIR_jg20146.t2 [Rhizophagus irregularis DAOM 181602=DAOM 197198]|nr:hypothetical protein RIR_jg20146.t2 [Rhizophagus irregularis DAOM 181602=DAOM 197198]
MAYLIEYTYGPEFITSNIHLALHIPDCCRDYGPIYSFWLFPFERLNGYIEPELMKIVLKNTLVDYHLSCKWTSGLLDESLHLLVPKKAVGSLAITAEREELQHFLFMRHNTCEDFYVNAANDDSVDTYPGEVQYYFEHALRFPEGTKTHLLAYVKWYKPAPSFSIRFKHSFMEPEISNTELWKAEYFQEGCDSLLAVHRILS